MGVEVTATSGGGGGGTPITTSLETQVTYDGVTWNFSTLVPVGRFEAGIKDGNGLYPPFVVSDRNFNITSVTPVSQSIGGYQANGVMEDPYTSGDSQGWDAMLAANTNLGNSASIYSSALNIDPGNTGSAISVSIGDNRSFVKTVRLSGATTTSWQMLDRYVTLTVLDTAPDEGAFMPSPSQTGSKTIFNINDLNSSALRSITMPASMEAVSTSKARVPSDLGAYGFTGVKLRGMRLDAEIGVVTNQYSAFLAPLYARFLAQLHNSAISAADKQEMLEKAIQFGIQLYGLTTRGWGVIASRLNGAGQQGALSPWIYYAAFLLNNSTILTAAQGTRTSWDGNSDWIKSSDVGAAVFTQSDDPNTMTFFEEMVGMPNSWPEDENALLHTNYRAEQAQITTWENLAIEMLQNGPGGVSGTQAILNGASLNDTASQRAAVIGYVDRVRTWQPRTHLAAGGWTENDWKDLYDLVVDTVLARTKWTGIPDMLVYGDNAFSSLYDDDIFTAGDGVVNFNINGREYATETVTRYDVSVSMDGGVQFKTFTNTGSSGSVSVLRGQQHYCRMRQVSASGPSIWSLNIPSVITDPNPGIVTTTGTAANSAPVVDVAPAIMFNRYPAWEAENYYEPADTNPTTLDVDSVFLAIGGGYWTGYPAPSLTYQWQRSDDGVTGWTNISTAKVRTRTAADAGKYLRGQVTATNTTTAVTETTAVVKCPDITTLPAGTLVDTNFDGRSVVDYETQLANVTVSGGTFTHDPTLGVNSLSSGSVSVGRIWADKSAADVFIQFPFKGRATANTTYSIVADIVAYAPETFTNADGNYTISVLDGNGSTLGTWTFNPPGETDNFTQVSFLYQLNDTFTVPAGLAGNALDLSIRVLCDTSSGNARGGSPMLCKLQVVAV